MAKAKKTATKPQVEEEKPKATEKTAKVEEKSEGEVVVDEAKQTAESTENLSKIDAILEKLNSFEAQQEATSEDPAVAASLAKVESLETAMLKVVDNLGDLRSRLDAVEKIAQPVKAKASYVVEKFEGEAADEEQKARHTELNKMFRDDPRSLTPDERGELIALNKLFS